MPLPDGVRLATTVIRAKVEPQIAAPIVLVRTLHAVSDRAANAHFFGRQIAESGYTVVLQECRGHGASEGEFVPFEREGHDGAATLAWIADQPFGQAEVGLLGFGYAGFAAWAALAEAPERVVSIATGFHPRAPYDLFYAGGALQLDATLRFALGTAESPPASRHALDLDRGAWHRPVSDADRVALRRSTVWSDILAHPDRDEFWRKRTPDLPSRVPATLVIAGWYDAALPSQLRDHAALCRLAKADAEPDLVIGPWSAGRDVRGRISGEARGRLLRTVIGHFDRHLPSSSRAHAKVSVFSLGDERWREFAAWPPPNTSEQRYHLRADHGSESRLDDGSLTIESPTVDEAPKRFRFDPEDPVPSLGGVLARAPGPVDQRAVEARADVLCYTTAPLCRDLSIAGPVRLDLFVASNAPDSDFTAKLVLVAPGGTAKILCDGIARARHQGREGGLEWFEAGTPRRIAIDLGATVCRVSAHHRLRIEVSSSNFPRFDRNTNGRQCPERAAVEEFAIAEQTIFHDAARPSHLTLFEVED
jgi:putative CocE/NonD family hydrolase